MNIRFILAVVSASVALASASAATIRAVSRESDRTGEWAEAYVGIDAALAAAGADDTVLVASGTYAVSATLEPAKAGLVIQSANISTGEPDPEGTVLDGGGSVRIMNVKAKRVTVSGFTFANGYCAGSGAAALRLESGNTAQYFCVSNCVFRGNSSGGDGTCVYTYTNKDGTIADCVFTNNTMTVTGGGAAYGCAIYTQMNAENADNRILVRGCDFRDNTIVAGLSRGSVVSAARAIVLDGCTFGQNSFTRDGTSSSANEGGYVRVGGYSEIRDCTFTGEAISSAGYGTYLQLTGAGHSVVSNCQFTAISESAAGFGIVHVSGNATEFHDCSFTGCSAKGHLLFILSKSGHLFRNCLFAGNSNPSGGIIHQQGCTGYTIESCTFAGNSDAKNALVNGGATPCTNLLVNPIFTAPIETPTAVKTVVASNCCMTALLGGEHDSGNIASSDPGFKRPLHGNYRLLSTSPCVDAGLALAWMTAERLDLSGKARVAGAAPDIGCHERQPGEFDTSLLVVPGEEFRTGAWADASTDVQGVVDSAEDGDLILVRSGEYRLAETIVISNKTVTFRSCSPETLLPDRDGTVFDGAQCEGRAMVVSTGPMETVDSAYGPTPSASHPIVVDGFTFRGFSAAEGGAVWFGGQGSVNGSPAMITNCAFICNSASSNGGAVRMFHGGRIAGCLFEGNTAGGKGGAVYCESTQAYSWNVQGWDGILDSRDWYFYSIVGCTFRTNTAASHGGAVTSHRNVVLRGCLLDRNSAGYSMNGAGLYAQFGSRVESCVFSGNTFAKDVAANAATGYGTACCVGGSSLVSNCVATAGGSGYGAIYTAGSKTFLAVDCISTNNVSEGFWVNGGTIRQCLSAANESSGIRQFQSSSAPLNIENCTIAGNGTKAAVAGIAISVAANYNTNFVCNSIICGNGGGVVSIATDDGRQRSEISNSMVDADAPSMANVIFTGTWRVPNVRFVDAAAGDYRLGARSPARERSTVLPWMTSGASDIGGNPRIVSLKGLPVSDDAAALPDLGCYECQEYGVPPGIMMLLR